jgi:hypothetical protein
MPRTIDRLPTILSGVSGQYFVAAELSRRGYIATLTLRNTRGVDILAARADASKSVGIQVKTNQGQKKVWLLDKKAEDVTADNLVYVFVSLNGCSHRAEQGSRGLLAPPPREVACRRFKTGCRSEGQLLAEVRGP